MLPRMIRLAELTWPEARRLARGPRSVVLLPLGAVEQHGPHLPLSVDWIGSEELARRVAPHLRRRGGVPLLVPSLPYGASPLAAAWPGTVSLTPATTARLIVEVVRGLARHGFRRFVLTNYQADPGHLRAIARAPGACSRGGHACRCSSAGFAPDDGRANPMLDPRVRALMRSPRPAGEWHGGELETAMMLAVAPSSRAARRGAPAAGGVGGLGGGARARRADVRGDESPRARLLWLAGGGAREHRASGDGAARPAHRRRPCSATWRRGRRDVSGARPQASDRAVAEAVHRVVVDETDRLHERVADGRAHEAEAAPTQVGAERPRDLGLGRDLAERAPADLQRPAVDEAPHVRRRSCRARPARPGTRGRCRSRRRSCPVGARCPRRRAAGACPRRRSAPPAADRSWRRRGDTRRASSRWSLHDSPACAPSRIRNSNSRRSSRTGTPHSSSW